MNRSSLGATAPGAGHSSRTTFWLGAKSQFGISGLCSRQMAAPPCLASVAALRQHLERHGVPVESFGVAEARSIEHLLVQLRSAASGDSSLRLLPSTALRALRSSDFSEVLAPRLWVEGRLLLPPHTIRRAYLVTQGSAENVGVELDVSTIDRDVLDEEEAATDGVASRKNRSSNPGFEARKKQKNAIQKSQHILRYAAILQVLHQSTIAPL